MLKFQRVSPVPSRPPTHTYTHWEARQRKSSVSISEKQLVARIRTRAKRKKRRKKEASKEVKENRKGDGKERESR